MAQLTIYLDDETAKQMGRAAEEAGLSRSRWVTNLIREKARAEWPEAVRRLAGAWRDFPELEEIRTGLVEDAPREPL